jgi:outer membrane protein assembly factor BamB
MEYKIIGGNNQQTYQISKSGPKTEPKVIWSLKDFESASAPFVNDKILYISREKVFHAINADNGKIIWTYDIPGRATPPAILGDKIIIGGNYIDNYLYILDKATGRELYKYRTGSNAGIFRTPIFEDNKMMFAAGSSLHALDPNTWKPVWKSKVGVKTDYHPVTSANGMVFVCTNEGYGKHKIYCFNINDGSGIRKINAPGMLSHLLGINKEIYFTDSENNINVMDISSGDIRKIKVSEGKNSRESYIASDGEVLLVTFDYIMAVYHIQSGKLSLKFKSSAIIGQPVIADNCVYFPTCGNGIYCLDIKNDKELFHLKTEVRSTYSCSIDDGTLYFAGSMTDNEMIAYKNT